jgi:RNA polymerase sigma-70 factor (ECF subfamily)
MARRTNERATAGDGRHHAMGEAGRHRVEPYLRRLYGYAYCLSGEREEARDLVQDCVVKALGAAAAPHDEPAYRAWLFKILRHSHIDRRRRDGHAAERLDPERLDREPLNGSWQVRRGEDHLLSRLTVRHAMARLSPPHREIIALVDLFGFSYSEAAGLLDIPPGTVMSRISRARQALLRLVADGNLRELPRRAHGDA